MIRKMIRQPLKNNPLNKINQIKVYLGADHAGFVLKERVKRYMLTYGWDVCDLGSSNLKPGDDYPDYALRVAKRVAQDIDYNRHHPSKKAPKTTLGILFCGSAEGMCIAANKVVGIRAVNPHNIKAVKLARSHEDANILCLAGGASLTPQPSVSLAKARNMLKIFATTPFSGEPRHLRRIKKISSIEKASLGRS